jgi:hypothetical protein
MPASTVSNEANSAEFWTVYVIYRDGFWPPCLPNESKRCAMREWMSQQMGAKHKALADFHSHYAFVQE